MLGVVVAPDQLRALKSVQEFAFGDVWSATHNAIESNQFCSSNGLFRLFRDVWIEKRQLQSDLGCFSLSVFMSVSHNS